MKDHVYARTPTDPEAGNRQVRRRWPASFGLTSSKTQSARDMYEEIRRRACDHKMSWAFDRENANDEYHRDEDGKVIKIVRAITDVEQSI